MDLKTCNTCGVKEYSLVDILSYLQTDKVKRICYGCQAILDKSAQRMHLFAEKEAAKAEKAMKGRMDKLKAQEYHNGNFFFLLNLRSIFSKRVVHAAFSVTEPK